MNLYKINYRFVCEGTAYVAASSICEASEKFNTFCERNCTRANITLETHIISVEYVPGDFIP